MKRLFSFLTKTSDREAPIEVSNTVYDQLQRELQNPGGLEYILQMVWQGRGDKFSRERVPLYDWLTRQFVRTDLAKTYTGFSSGHVHFQGENHYLLARKLMHKLDEAKARLVVQQESPSVDNNSSNFGF